MLDSNYFILNRKAQRFSEMRAAGKTVIFLDDKGRPVNYGVVAMDDSVYALLCCEEVNNVTLVTDKAGTQNVITILWNTDEGYRNGIETLKKISGRRFSPQNKKLNRYAESVAEKLSLGVRLRITDAVDESQMSVCPECGMLNPPGSMYCLDCGAEISK